MIDSIGGDYAASSYTDLDWELFLEDEFTMPETCILCNDGKMDVGGCGEGRGR